MADKQNNSDYFVTMTSDPNDSKQGLSEAGSAVDLQSLIARATGAGRGLPPVREVEPGVLRRSRHGDQRPTGRGSTWAPRSGACRWCNSSPPCCARMKDGKTYLVTPVEKVGIRIEDAHFVAVEMNASGNGHDQVLTFRTNVGEVVEAGPEHPLRFVDEEATDGLKPYLHVRGRLEALVARPVMYEIAEIGEEIEIDGVKMFAVRSRGAVFPVMPIDRLNRLSGDA